MAQKKKQIVIEVNPVSGEMNVKSTVNLLNPKPGTAISEARANDYVHSRDIDVRFVNPKRKG